MAWSVSFGSALANDGFGFAGRGEVEVADDVITLTGRRQWPVLLKALIALVVLLGLSFLLPVYIDAWLGFAAVWIVANMIFPRPTSVTIERADIDDTIGRGRCVRMLVHTRPPARPVVSILCARSAAEADEIRTALRPVEAVTSTEQE